MGERENMERRAAAFVRAYLRRYYSAGADESLTEALSQDVSWIDETDYALGEAGVRALIERRRNAAQSMALAEESLSARSLDESHFLVTGQAGILLRNAGKNECIRRRVTMLLSRRATGGFLLSHAHLSAPLQGTGSLPAALAPDADIGSGFSQCLCDREHTYLFIGNGLLKLLGCPRDVFLRASGGTALGAVYPADREDVLRQWNAADEEGVYTARYRMCRTDGAPVWVKETGKKRVGGEKAGQICSVYTDITAEMEHHELLRRQIDNDSLTGLLNHRAAYDRGLALFAQDEAQDGSVLVMDVDNFKTVNDTLGHWQGDDVLRTFARILTYCVPRDAVVGRIGGDEFLVLMKTGGQSGAMNVANAILQQTRAVFSQQGTGISCSIGASGSREDRRGFKEIFNAADAALYRAKQKGRNRVEAAE